FLLSVDSLNPDRMAALLADPVLGYGYRFSPFRNSFRIGLGDVEIGAKYRIVTGSRYAAAVAGTVRLPTAGRDFADDLLRQSLGDHQLDVEARLIQELTVAGRVWLNLAVRAGVQRPGTRFVRVAPPAAVLVPAQAGVLLGWDPGDYAAAACRPRPCFGSCCGRRGRSLGAGADATRARGRKDRPTGASCASGRRTLPGRGGRGEPAGRLA